MSSISPRPPDNTPGLEGSFCWSIGGGLAILLRRHVDALWTLPDLEVLRTAELHMDANQYNSRIQNAFGRDLSIRYCQLCSRTESRLSLVSLLLVALTVACILIKQHNRCISGFTRVHLADGMRLPMLTLKRVLLILVTRVVVLRFPARSAMMLGVVGMLRYGVRIHLFQCVQGQLDVIDQAVTSRTGEVFSNDDSHEFELLTVWSHGVGRHDPAALTQVMGNGELIIMVLGLGVESECYKG